MPFHLNQVNVSGTLTRTPEVTYTPKGSAVCQFSLAVNRHWKTDDGEKREETTFLDCEAWGKTAETIGKWTDKGHTIFVEGRLKQDTWEDKQTGQKRSKIKIVVERMHFVSKPKDADDDGERPPAKPKPAPAKSSKPAPDPDLDGEEPDDIPF